jgi:uncharacterized lipoprotein YajG
MKINIQSKIIVIAISLLVAGCDLQSASDELVTEGNIVAISEKQLLIQERTSVVRLDMRGATGQMLAARYKVGQEVTLLGRRSVDEHGDTREDIKIIVFADGHRLRVAP